MKKVNIARANQIEADIKELESKVSNLKSAIEEYKRSKKDNVPERSMKDIYSIGIISRSINTVYIEDLPIEYDLFALMCIPKLQEQIDALEKELETL